MNLKTKVAFVFLGLVAIALIIGLITLFIVEPTAMLPVAFTGFFVLIAWAAVTVSDYYFDRKYKR